MSEFERPRRARLKTYSHLAGRGRVPSEYEITSERLLYYTERGFELPLPIADWYARHQQAGTTSWESFADPARLTYTAYVEDRARRWEYIAGLQAADTGAVDKLTAGWRARLEERLAVLRYPLHGLQMAAAYVGQMAPSGKLVICAAFQAADELGRIEVLARRLFDLGPTTDGRRAWEEEAEWQPLRERIERLLATWAFPEALAALLATKQEVEPLFRALAREARDAGDVLFAEILVALDDVTAWHVRWLTAALELRS